MTAAVTFREVLTGHVSFHVTDYFEGSRRGKLTGTELVLELEVSIDDTDRFISCEQIGQVTGSIVCVAIGGRIPIIQGTMELINFRRPGADHRIAYNLQGAGNKPIALVGHKELTDDPGADMAQDLSMLFVEFQYGEDRAQNVARGIVCSRPGEWFRQLRKLKGDPPSIYRFGHALLGEMSSIYRETPQ
jgi:hypothetical protein